jgi:hypothetical protein
MIDSLTSIGGWQVYVWILAIILPAAIHLRAARLRDPSDRAEVVLMYVLGVSGAISMFNVVAHTVFAHDVAASIGWPADSPFQTEVGFANLAIGIVGFACSWRYDFWLPAAIAKSVFAWGAGLTHVLDIVRTGNLASNNAGLGLPPSDRDHCALLRGPAGAQSRGHQSCAVLVDSVATGR